MNFKNSIIIITMLLAPAMASADLNKTVISEYETKAIKKSLSLNDKISLDLFEKMSRQKPAEDASPRKSVKGQITCEEYETSSCLDCDDIVLKARCEIQVVQ